MGKCERCCFWSDQLAKSEHGTMLAVCLNPNSARYSNYTNEDSGCEKHLAGEPIDRAGGFKTKKDREDFDARR